MDVQIRVGDVLKLAADVLICPANPWLNLCGGVSGALLAVAGPCFQDELHEQLRLRGASSLPPGTIVVSPPGPLPVRHIVHAVAIDDAHSSTVNLVEGALRGALAAAAELGASTISLPALAAGIGPLSLEQFATALHRAMRDADSRIACIMVVVLNPENAALLHDRLAAEQAGPSV